MPVINGMKMACEPCIRGHRSTKCTHANERLMVPVKKPGRPLSACPHLHSQLCGCSSVTAAIPRKQKCHCGTGTTNGALPPVQPRPVASAITDIPSPTRVSFRVQKGASSSRPGSRKPSFDLSSLERMDVGNINVVPFQAWSTQQALTTTINDRAPTSATYVQYANGFSGPGYGATALKSPQQPQYPDFPFPLDESVFGLSSSSSAGNLANGSYLPLETLEESFVVSDQPSGSGSCCGTMPALSNGSTDPNSRAHITQDPRNGCCSSKATPDQSRLISTSTRSVSGTLGNNGSLKAQDSLFLDNLSTQSTVYQPYMSRATVYAYPPSYGSYQHPLQPSEWRKSVASNLYTQSELHSQVSNETNTFLSASDNLANLDTLHTCSCGDGCQCIGCAAHPYNEPTQRYVRSAYDMINEPSPPGTADLTNGHGNDIAFSPTSDWLASKRNGNGSSHSNGEATSPHLANTPSDPGTAEEQSLSAADFFFVNYPFTTDSCGGDTNSCPCGDDCQCIGCTIHRIDDPIPDFPVESMGNGHGHGYSSSNGAEMFGNDSPLISSPVINSPEIKSEESEPKAVAKSCCGG